LQPLLSGGHRLVSTGVDLVEPAAHVFKPGAAPSHKLIAADVRLPWLQVSGEVHAPLLRSLLWQVKCVLARFPGAPEGRIAALMDHTLGAAHLRELLRLMERNGHVEVVRVPVGCASVASTGGAASGAAVPDWLGGAAAHAVPRSDLCAVREGWVPAIFGRDREVTEAPLSSHYCPVLAHCYADDVASGEWPELD
jgi:hypothetical protein